MRLTVSVLGWEIFTIEIVWERPELLATVHTDVDETVEDAVDDEANLSWCRLDHPDMDGAGSADWGHIISEKRER